MKVLEIKKDEKFYDAIQSMLKALGHEMSDDDLQDKIKELSIADLTLLFKAIEDSDDDEVKALLGLVKEYKSPSNRMGDQDPGAGPKPRNRDRVDKGRFIPQKNIVAGGKKQTTGGAYDNSDQSVEPGGAIDSADTPSYLTVTTSTGDQQTIQSPVGIKRIKRLAGIR
tara:strand:- start:191 stop:694 length:504 start_codon:yes stop_codon:yes gene_type:complete